MNYEEIDEEIDLWLFNPWLRYAHAYSSRALIDGRGNKNKLLWKVCG